jgi:hypothetical protein
MTAAVASGPWSRARVLAAARVHLANWPMALGFPLAIMSSSLFVNAAIFASMGDAVENAVTGGLASLYIVQFVICWQGLFQNFTFAVGLNVTRRSFYAASVLVAAGQSLVFSLLLYALELGEGATDGWGVDLRFFGPLPLLSSTSPVTILVYAVPLLMVSTAGLFLGAVAKRWGAVGVFVLSVLFIVVVGGAVALVFAVDGWPAVFEWWGDQSGVALAVGWALIPTALALGGGWLALRRAVP